VTACRRSSLSLPPPQVSRASAVLTAGLLQHSAHTQVRALFLTAGAADKEATLPTHTALESSAKGL